jgi:SAM-dependent methyltransferase
MPLNLSRRTAAPPIREFYASIHENITARAFRAGPPQPTAQEFIQTLKRFSMRPVGIALDAGCGGTASFSVACAKQGFQNVMAVDINERSLRHARAVTKALDLGAIRLCAASVGSMPFRDKTFDFAVCSGVVHHTPDPEGAVRELARVMKPRGILYISVYCFAGSVFEWIVRVLRWIGAAVPFRPMHGIWGWSRVMNNFVLDHMYVPTLWVFTAEEVREIFGRNGLAITAEWPSAMDPFARFGRIGRWISREGLIRVWLCTRF